MDEIDELKEELKQLFPLSEKLRFEIPSLDEEGSLPLIVSMLAAMTDPEVDGDVCALLPVRGNTACYVSLLAALSSLATSYPVRLREYITNGFQVGEKVKVLPTNYVFEFEGVFDGYGDFFKLKELGKGQGSRSFPFKEAVRLEKTDKQRPQGRLNTDLKHYVPSNLDRLIEIETGGNQALLKNEIMLVTSRATFLDFIENVIVSSVSDPNLRFPLSEVLPWGTVTPEGDLDFSDSSVAGGQPLIAVSSRIEHVAQACTRGTLKSPRVVIDGLDHAASSLQAFDDVLDYSRLLVLAEHSRSKSVTPVMDRGCALWMPGDLANGYIDPDRPILRDVSSRSLNYSKVRVSIHECSSELVDTIAENIMCAEALLKDEEHSDDVRIIAVLFSRLLDISAAFSINGEFREEFNVEIERGYASLRERRQWIPSEAFSFLEEAMKGLESCVNRVNSDFINDKAEKLMELLEDNTDQNIHVVSESARIVSSIRRFLGDAYPKTTVRLASQAPEDSCDLMVIPGWPRARYFDQLMSRYDTQEIHILSFAFETKWFNGSIKKRDRLLNGFRNVASSLNAVSNIRSSFKETSIPKPQEIFPADISDLLRFEERISKVRKGVNHSIDGEESRDAHYVGFVGTGYAFLLDSYQVPVVTDIITGGTMGSKIPMKKVTELEEGDYVLFRANTDKDIIRFIAETKNTSSEYSRVRGLAESWKTVLRNISPLVLHERLETAGFDKTDVTLANWLNNHELIGPGTKEDLQVIARASEDRVFTRQIDEIWNAIHKVRGWHLSAGFSLTKILQLQLPKQLGQLDGDEIRMELTLGDKMLGEVLILRVEAVDLNTSPASLTKVNKVLRED